MKKVVRSIIIFWGIVALFPLGYGIYYFFTKGEGFHWLVGYADAVASATTWLDSDADGIQEPDEKAFANVCVSYGQNYESGNLLDYFCEREYNYHLTDENGEWGEFLPGSTCDEVFIFAKVPDGFQATTDLAYNGCWAKFGFVTQNVQVKQKTVSVDEFIRKRTFYSWVLRIVSGLIILAIGILGTIWLQREI